MVKRFLSLLILGVLAFAAVATGATSHHHASKHSLSGTVKIVDLERKGNTPAPGTSANYAGRVASAQGSGAITGKTNYLAGAKFSGTNRTFFAHGTFKNTLKGTGTPHSDGTVTFSGSGEVIGGTGRYSGAHGSFKFTGKTKLTPGAIATFKVTGSATY